MKATDIRNTKNNILEILLTKPSLQYHEITQNKVDVLSCLDVIEEDGYIDITRDAQGFPIVIRPTIKGHNFIRSGGYKHPIIEFLCQLKGIFGSIGDLVSKLTGASIIVLAIYIMQ